MINSLIFKASRRYMLRRPFSTASVAAGNSTGGSGSGYVSPFQDFFDMMEEGRTSLGTTADTPQPPPERFLKSGIREDALRFRTMHYPRMQLPPHVEPGEHRVTLKVGMEDIPIETEVEREIILHIVGNRVNHEKQELRLSSDQFGSRIENKRHLVSMLDRIVLSAKRLAKELDEEQDERRVS